MFSKRLRSAKRAPSAEAVGIGFIRGRRFTFNKMSSDGSGKCDAEATGHKKARVYGVLFEITASDKAQLDYAEGLGKGYREEKINVATSLGIRNAFTYIANAKQPDLQPYHWYKAFVITGATEHNLPRPYIEWLRTFDSKPDPDINRRAENESVLFDE